MNIEKEANAMRGGTEKPLLDKLNKAFFENMSENNIMNICISWYSCQLLYHLWRTYTMKMKKIKRINYQAKSFQKFLYKQNFLSKDLVTP